MRGLVKRTNLLTLVMSQVVYSTGPIKPINRWVVLFSLYRLCEEKQKLQPSSAGRAEKSIVGAFQQGQPTVLIKYSDLPLTVHYIGENEIIAPPKNKLAAFAVKA